MTESKAAASKAGTVKAGAPDAAARERSPRSSMVGVVVSTKMEKTITVQVERMYKHPKYGKYIRERKRYHVHAPEGGVTAGDVVEVTSTRPWCGQVRIARLRPTPFQYGHRADRPFGVDPRTDRPGA